MNHFIEKYVDETNFVYIISSSEDDYVRQPIVGVSFSKEIVFGNLKQIKLKILNASDGIFILFKAKYVKKPCETTTQ